MIETTGDQHQERLKKLDAIRALGCDPYGGKFPDATPIKTITDAFTTESEGKKVTVAGRIMAIRGHGKASFGDVRDQSGRMQFYVKKDVVGDNGFALFRLLDIGDLAGLSGSIFKTKTGEITIQVEHLTILAKSLHPLPEKWHGLKDPEIRHRRRYLDMIANPEVRETFTARARILSLMRRFLDDRGYVEVETPMMHAIPGGAAAKPFATHHNALDMKLYMRIATEIPLKKLLVGGIEKVYEIGKNFRNEGIDAQHNPEFTCMELYHARGDLRTIMELTENLVVHLAKETRGATRLPYGEGEIDLTPPWPREDYVELLKEHAGITALEDGELRDKVKAKGIDPAGMARIDLIDKVFGEYVEPHLQSAVFVCGQPLEMTPLCRELPGRPGFADRFEAFVGGMELANAYTELNDPVEQRKRLVAQAGGGADEMTREGKLDEDFLLALEHGMPPAGGLGIGIDRLVMLLTNNKSIREVILFPLLRDIPGS